MNRHRSHSMHREISLLLPWYVNGTLTPADQDRVEGHVSGCQTCREEVALLESVQQATQAEPPAMDVATRGLEKLMDRIDQTEKRHHAVPLALDKGWHRLAEFFTSFPRWAAAIPVLLVLVTAYWMIPQWTNGGAGYETLSSSDQSAGPPTVIEIRTNPDSKAENIRRDLESITTDATLETAADDHYFLRLPANTSAEEVLQIMDALRSNPTVLSAKLFGE